MHRRNTSTAAATVVDHPRPRSFITLATVELEPELEELPDHEVLECPASVSQSGRFRRQSNDVTLPDAPAELTMELTADDLEEPAEQRRVAVMRRSARVPAPEGTDVLTTADLQVLIEQNPTLAPTDTVMFYCRAGESLPSYAVHADELPRFASKKLERMPAIGSVPPPPRVPAQRLPAFSIHEAASRPSRSAVASRRVPPVRLPSFRIEEDRPRLRVPTPRLPKFTLD